MTDLSHAFWQTSSRGNEEGACVNEEGACVEVARNLGRVAAVRDSKSPRGAALTFDRDRFTGIVAAVEAGEFDL